ncbi:FAS1 domain-containing protein [Fomes fomentarius]|nr:FAS1 domain-containing protein [Fomes fomentarius]
MRFAALSSILLGCVPVVLGQNITFLAGLLQTLQSSGHTQLANVATKLNASSSGQSLLTQLSSGSPFVLFAPDDQALSSLPNNVTSDNDALADLIAYHMVSGNFSGVTTHYPNVTLGRTLLADPKVVQLEGGKHQVVAWATRADGKVHVLNQLNDSVVTNTTSFGNVTINTVDHALIIPESFAETVRADNGSLTGAQNALNSVSIPVFNSTTNQTATQSFFDLLNTGLRGFTFFSPNNSAIQSASSDLSSLASNQTALIALFQNHVKLSGANQTSAAGEPLSFSRNETGQYVTSGNVTALIVQSDVLLPNGVIHVIDRVLVNTQSDSGAASSAASSASSVATQTQSATAPIGFSATATLPGASGGSNSASNTSNAALKACDALPSVQLVASVAVAIVGVFGGFVLGA